MTAPNMFAFICMSMVITIGYITYSKDEFDNLFSNLEDIENKYEQEQTVQVNQPIQVNHPIEFGWYVYLD